MDEFIIVSDDICIVKQIINTVNRIKKINPTMSVLNINDFKKYELAPTYNMARTYFIDIYNIEKEFIDISRRIKEQDKAANIIIITNNTNKKSLLNSQGLFYGYITKEVDFSKKLFNMLSLLKEKESNDILVSNGNIPVTLNKNNINSIYRWPNKSFSINYKNKDENLVISFRRPTLEINNMLKSNFYMETNKKRKRYSETFKQLLVDLHLIYKIDCHNLSRLFNVDARYIKAWSDLKKYNRKIGVFRFYVGKIIIRAYLKIDGRK